MAATGNTEKVLEKTDSQSTGENSSSSARKGRRSTADVPLSDRLAIVQSACSDLAPYGINVEAVEFYSAGVKQVAIIIDKVKLIDGRLVPLMA